MDAQFKAPDRDSRDPLQDRETLMLSVADHFLEDAKTEGWFDAILLQVQSHPRAIRTKEYADHCDEIWGSELPSPYPSFAGWRKKADRYIDLATDRSH